MKSFRENPDGEENQMATKQNEREVFALKQQIIYDRQKERPIRDRAGVVCNRISRRHQQLLEDV